MLPLMHVTRTYELLELLLLRWDNLLERLAQRLENDMSMRRERERREETNLGRRQTTLDSRSAKSSRTNRGDPGEHGGRERRDCWRNDWNLKIRKILE